MASTAFELTDVDAPHAPAAPLPAVPVRSSSSSVSSSISDRTVTRRQRPGSAPPAPTLERAPRADVAAGIGRRYRASATATTSAQQRPAVDRVLAASAPAEEAGSPLWAAPEHERVAGQHDFFPVAWVAREGAETEGREGLPPAPVRSPSPLTSTSTSTSSSSHHQRSRPIFPELHGSRLVVIDRHPFGNSPLLIPVTRGTTAAAAVLGAGVLVAAAAAAVARRARGGGKRQQQHPASPLSLSSTNEGEDNSADALLKRRGEAAAARLRSRFAGALDGGDQSGGGSLGGEDDADDESEECTRRSNREAQRALRSFFSKSKMHLVDEDAWSKEKKE